MSPDDLPELRAQLDVARDERDALLAAQADAGEEAARQWVGHHFHQIKGAVADALNGASVRDGDTITPERAQQLATLVMASMSHVFPEPPWQGEIREALTEFGAELERGDADRG